MTQILNFFKKIYKAIENAQMQKGVMLVQERMMRKRIYRETYAELSKLTDKELNDIGISRGMIHSIAMEAYFDGRVETNPSLRDWA